MTDRTSYEPPRQILDKAYLRYETDPEFHAQVYQAAKTAEAVLRERGIPHSMIELRAGAAVALYLADKNS